jgi:GT2 family glycosyltransferase
MTLPLRRVLQFIPVSGRRLGRRVLKAAWWTITLQLPARLAERRGAAAVFKATAATIPSAKPADQRALKEVTDSGLFDPSYYLPLLPHKELIRKRAGSAGSTIQYRPVISVLMPSYNSEAAYLARAIDSVRTQTYSNWELCIADDGSARAETLEVLSRYERLDERIKVTRCSVNSGISAATNTAMAVAAGEFIAMLDHDDELLPDALREVVLELNESPSTDVIYTDQAYIEADGALAGNFFKPDWSPELLRGVMYVGHLLIVRRKLALEVGGFDSRFDKVQDFEFMLRLSERTKLIRHIPQVLYYWRKVPGSVAYHGDEKGKVEPIQAAAVNAHLQRCGIPGIAAPSDRFAHRLIIRPNSRTYFPTVSVIIHAPETLAGFRERLLALRSHTDHPKVQFIVVPRGSESQLATELSGVPALIAKHSVPHGVTINQLAEREAGEFIVLMNGELEICSGAWLENLLLLAEAPDSGCVAPLVLQHSGKVLHAGLVLGINDSVGFAMNGWDADADGYAGSLSCTREVAAVAGHCFMISRDLLNELGGLSYLTNGVLAGADLSLRAHVRSKRNLCTPRVVFRYSGPRSEEAAPIEQIAFVDAWQNVLTQGDPYHNPNFSLSGSGFS